MHHHVIAASSWPSTSSCGSPTTSRTNATLGAAAESSILLDRLEASLLGRHDDVPEAVALRRVLSERKLPPRHAQDILTAFRMDVTKLRYRDWDDLMNYCSFRPCRSGALCWTCMARPRHMARQPMRSAPALQIINTCRTARRISDLGPLSTFRDALAATGATVEDLGQSGEHTCRSANAWQGLAAPHRQAARGRARLFGQHPRRPPRVRGGGDPGAGVPLVAMLRTRDPIERAGASHPSVLRPVGSWGLFSGARNRLGRVFAAPQAPRKA